MAWRMYESADYRREAVARMLDCNPSAPESWPDDTIEGMILRAEKAYEESLMADARRMLAKAKEGK